MRGLGRLDRFNRLSEEEATGELLAVCHSRRWAEQVAAGRPYADLAALQRAADEHRRITRLRLERLMQR